MIKKMRLLLVTGTMLLFVMIMSGTVFAANSDVLEIGGHDILGNDIPAGVQYDSTSNTLTLDNYQDADWNSQINFDFLESGKTLTIKVVGNCSLVAIRGEGDLVIIGEGKEKSTLNVSDDIDLNSFHWPSVVPGDYDPTDDIIAYYNMDVKRDLLISSVSLNPYRIYNCGGNISFVDAQATIKQLVHTGIYSNSGENDRKFKCKNGGTLNVSNSDVIVIYVVKNNYFGIQCSRLVMNNEYLYGGRDEDNTVQAEIDPADNLIRNYVFENRTDDRYVFNKYSMYKFSTTPITIPDPQTEPQNDPQTTPAEAPVISEKQDLPAVSITKPAAAKKAVTVKWKKVSKKNQKKIQGVEIQVAADKNFKTIVKTTTAGKKKTSKKIKGLKAKKTYWVRIRAYKSAADGKHVSAWKVKKFKTK